MGRADYVVVGAGSAGCAVARRLAESGASVAEQWSTRFLSTPFERLPVDVVEQAKLHLLDTLGCALAAHALGVATEGRSVMVAQGGEPESTAIGSYARLPAANAAFANAMLCHALDFDAPEAAAKL